MPVGEASQVSRFLQGIDPADTFKEWRKLALQDPYRFVALLAPHRTQLLVICRSLLRRKDDSDDALQEALLQAWRDFPRYREGASFRAWLMKYLVNIIRNRNRHLREDLEVPLPAELADPETLLDWESAYEHFFREPERILATIDEDLAEAIRALSEAERLVLLLRCVGQLSYREVSEVLAMPEGTAMSHLSRARKHLRRYLSGKVRQDRSPEGRNER